MDEASIEQARLKLGDIVDRARIAGQFTVITRQGKPAAVVVSVEWHDGMRKLLQRYPSLCQACHKDVPLGEIACAECTATGEASRRAIIEGQRR